MIVVVLFSLSAFSTGTILGWQFYNNEHSQIVAHAQSAQKLILTTNEQQLVENRSTIKKMIILAQFT